MLTLENEKPADQIFGRTQWWRADAVTFLVRHSGDEKRCGIYISGGAMTPSAEECFNRLGLDSDAEITLEPGIDCYAISCPSGRLPSLLDRLTVEVVGN